MAGIAVNYDKVLSLVGDVIRIALPPQTRDDPAAPITARAQ
jgi:V/A-type H+/Na+-transporting ATPase subunit B